VIVLADTSVWIDHWRRGNARLERLLLEDRVVLHPFVLGEIALGAVTPRAQVLEHLATLRAPRVAQQQEIMALIERARLWRRGIGWVDIHLLASALIEQIGLWTLDGALANAAREIGVGLPIPG
jgi:hypothetical protein